MQVVTKTVPDVSRTLLLTMICCGIAGGIVGRMGSSKLSGKATKMMFVALNLIIVCIPCWNIYRYLS